MRKKEKVGRIKELLMMNVLYIILFAVGKVINNNTDFSDFFPSLLALNTVAILFTIMFR